MESVIRRHCSEYKNKETDSQSWPPAERLGPASVMLALAKLTKGFQTESRQPVQIQSEMLCCKPLMPTFSLICPFFLFFILIVFYHQRV